MTESVRVLLAGGGSGGSATPVLAVAQELRRLLPGVELIYVGTRGGPEEALAKAQDIYYVGIASGKLRRYWDWRNFVDPFNVALGVWQAYRLARWFRPQVAFAAGGFASVPPIMGARLAGAKAVVHQQDVQPGMANRLLAPLASRITLSLPSQLGQFPRRKSSVTGNPVRREILEADPSIAYQRLSLDPRTPIIVVTGGGTGALGLNRLVAAAAQRLVAACQIVHLTGRGRAIRVDVVSDRYKQVEFLVEEMPHLLAAATLVVSRAGMGTLTELAALAKPTLLIPMPASHQWANALAFRQTGAVEIVNQESLTADRFADTVLSLLADEDRRQKLGQSIAGSMPRDAAERVAVEVLRQAGRPTEARATRP